MNTEKAMQSKRGPYKRYLKDPSFPIPKQTLWNWRTRDSYIATTSNTCCALSNETSMPLSLAMDQLADNSSSEEETEASPSQLKSSKLPTYSDAEELGAACESPTYSDAELGEDVGESPAYSSGEESDCGNALANASDADKIPSTSSPAQSPLYPGAKINAATGALLLHSLTMKHGLTHAALADILQLLRLHLPEHSTPAAYGSVHRLLNASSLKSSAMEGTACILMSSPVCLTFTMEV